LSRKSESLFKNGAGKGPGRVALKLRIIKNVMRAR